jgi:hypothetical protein
LLEVAEHGGAEKRVGASLVALSLLAKPRDDVRIEPKGELPLDGAIEGIADGIAPELFREFRDVGEVNGAVRGAASFAKRRLRAAVIELVESFFRTIFVITLALLSRGFAGGNDANRFFAGASPPDCVRDTIGLPIPLPQWQRGERRIVRRSFDRGREPSACFLKRDGLDLAGIELCHAASNLFVPRSSNGIIF